MSIVDEVPDCQYKKIGNGLYIILPIGLTPKNQKKTVFKILIINIL
jgi:hypothetical protein